MASNPNPFASDPSGLTRMLQAAFAAMPQGHGQLNRTAMPDFTPQESQMIDLGAGGPKPGSERGNFLSSLGDVAQTAGSVLGSAMSANQAANAASAMKNSPGAINIGGSAVPNAFGRTGGFAVNLPALPSRR